MITMKSRWVRSVSRVMVVNMVWLAGTVAPAGAESVQTASLENPGNPITAENFQERPNNADLADFQGNPKMRSNIHWAVQKAIQDYPQNDKQKFPEKNTVLGNAGNFGGFIITYSALLVGYLVLYVPVGSYGAAKCVFDKEGWNDCWNGHMNKTFH